MYFAPFVRKILKTQGQGRLLLRAPDCADAWERQIQQGKHVLFPVRLVSFEELEKWKCPGPKTGKDLGREIRKYFIPDFGNWKDHDSYQRRRFGGW
jgi:hypothetical protein